MKCSFCGTENVQGRTHCIACGTPLEQPAVPQELIASPVAEPVLLEPESPAALAPVPAPASAPEPVFVPPTQPAVQFNHVSIPEPEKVEEKEAETTITYPAYNPTPVATALDFSQPEPSIANEAVQATPVEEQVVVADPSPVSVPVEENYLDSTADLPADSVPEPIAQPQIPSVPAYVAPPSAPVSVPPVMPTHPPAAPSYLDNAAIEATVKNVVPGRVDVQFSDQDVEEASMPIHNENPVAVPSIDAAVDANDGVGESTDNPSRSGPWLAITVLVVIGILIIGVIYFVYRLIFGGSSQQGSLITQPLPVPTITISSQPLVTSSPVAVSVSANDQQREKDVADLRSALANYFSDNAKYPNATSYNSLLNSLISSRYLTRRIQDPLFPTQQYQYSVGADQGSYTITIQFEGLGSTLLSGSTTYQFGS